MRPEVLTNERDIVSALRQGLAARIGRERFELWFGSRIQWELKGDTVLVTAPNSFVLDHVRRQFAADIQVAVQTICGGSTNPEFRVESTMPNSLASKSPQTVATKETAKEDRSASQIVKRPMLSVHRDPQSNSSDHSAGAPRRRVVHLSNFVVGASNCLAHTAAQATVRRSGAVSPLFLYGPTGSGKSHLLEGICTAIRANSRASRALYLSAEQFTSLFLEALQGSGLPNFRRKSREVDLLAIDDIQFFAGKRATLLEFQHTLDALSRQGRQVVLAADRAPSELACLGAEVVPRLAGGLVCSIEWGDYEMRLEIARQFAQTLSLSVPEDVLQMIATEACGDARQIRGALNRLSATSEALKKPITLELARQALHDIFSASRRFVRLPDVERAVCEVFGMESKSLRDAGKTKAVSQPRMLAMWLARKYTRAAFSEIGEFFGRRSHSTVISAERKVEQWLAQHAQLQLGQTCWSIDDAIRRVETKLRTG